MDHTIIKKTLHTTCRLTIEKLEIAINECQQVVDKCGISQTHPECAQSCGTAVKKCFDAIDGSKDVMKWINECLKHVTEQPLLTLLDTAFEKCERFIKVSEGLIKACRAGTPDAVELALLTITAGNETAQACANLLELNNH